MPITLDQTTFLGPATVVTTDQNLLRLDLGDHYQWAELALAFPYRPAVGDVVLAIGQDDRLYVIGVLRGTGPTTLTVPGDLRIDAPRGAIELRAARGIRLTSPSVRVAAEKLELLARSVFEQFTTATRWVKETFQLRVDRLRTRVRSDYDLKAGSIRERAEADVKIDGQKIHLG